MIKRYSVLGFLIVTLTAFLLLLGAFEATPASARAIVDDVVDTASTYVCYSTPSVCNHGLEHFTYKTVYYKNGYTRDLKHVGGGGVFSHCHNPGSGNGHFGYVTEYQYKYTFY